MEFHSRACTKLILAGEHLVVHGYDGVAIPLFSKQTEITLSDKLNSHSINQETFAENQNSFFDANLHFFTSLLNFSEKQLQTLSEFKFQISLPDTGVGLGSSASFATAMIKILSQFLDQNLSQSKLLDLVFKTEKHYHGNPSGIDHNTIILETPILFSGATKKVTSLNFNLPDFINELKIVNTGKPEESTKQMVEYVTGKLTNFSLNTLSTLNENIPQLIQSLKTADKQTFKKIMNLYGEFLEQIPICTQEVISKNQSYRQEKGAAKVCGAGGLTGGSGICLYL